MTFENKDAARRDRVQDIEEWWNDPQIQQRIADLIAHAAGIGPHKPDDGGGGGAER